MPIYSGGYQFKNIQSTEDFRRIQMLFNTKNLLGMNEKIMMSRKLCEKYKPEIINIYNQVVIYIKNTKRFKVY